MPETRDEYGPQEWGRPQPQPKPILPEGQPRGEAGWVVPHGATFAGRVRGGSRNYFYTHDEAVLHSVANAERMRLDPVIDACLRLRTYPTALLPFHIDPDDDTDAFEVECAAKGERLLAKLPGMLYVKRWLLDDGIFKGRSAAQMRWEFVNKRGRVWHLPTLFSPIDGDKLVFFRDGRVGLLVHGSFDGPTEPTERGRAYVFTPEEREQFLVHEFEPEDRSYFKPQMAGAIHGTGLRGKLYWLWALKARVWSMGMDFLEWFARGVTMFYFEHGNKSHFDEVKAWVEGQIGSSAMLFPRMRDGGPGYKPVERLEVGTASPAFIQQLITEYFDDLFKMAILGQTLTSGTASTGLGSGVAEAHQGTFENFVKYDAVGLGETMTRDLLVPFYRSNFPGVSPGEYVLEVDDPNVQQMIDHAVAIYQMGGAIPEGALLDAAGIPEVKTGDTILTNVQPMQPAAVGGVPDDTPVVQGDPQGDPQTQDPASGMPDAGSSQGGGQPPIQLSLRQWATAVTAARRGDSRAVKLFRSRRVVVPGLSSAYTNRWQSKRR
jgi:hypothetical protein